MDEGHITRPVGIVDHSSNDYLLVATVNMKHSCLFKFSKVNLSGYFFKKNCHGKKLKRQTVKDKSMPTPIDLNRVNKLLSSTIDSCCLGSVRIFNSVSLHFGERGGTNLQLSIAT
jgi:hypothetical protein